MYTYKSSVVLARSPGAQYKSLDISKFSVADIFNTFAKVYLTLELDGASTVFVELISMKALYSSYSGTLLEWLDSVKDVTLDTVLTVPNTKIKYAKYCNSLQADYHVDITNIKNGTFPKYDKANNPDLVVTRPGYDTDMMTVYNNCLVTVNGYIHNLDADTGHFYIVDGAKSCWKSNVNHVGILSFLDIGHIERLPIKAADIYGQDNGGLLRDKLYFTVDRDLTGKTCLLSMGGYLLFPEDNVFMQTGQRTFMLNITSTNIVEKLMESSFYSYLLIVL